MLLMGGASSWRLGPLLLTLDLGRTREVGGSRGQRGGQLSCGSSGGCDLRHHFGGVVLPVVVGGVSHEPPARGPGDLVYDLRGGRGVGVGGVGRIRAIGMCHAHTCHAPTTVHHMMHLHRVHRGAGPLQGVDVDDPRPWGRGEGPAGHVMTQHAAVVAVVAVVVVEVSTFDLRHIEAVHLRDVAIPGVEVPHKAPVAIVVHHLHHLPPLYA